MRTIDFTALAEYQAKGLVDVKEHPIEDLLIINYTPLAQFSRCWDDFLIQCRGLIIQKETGIIIAQPFKKFFNLGEIGDAKIPDEEFEIFTKYDGSLGIMFHYNNAWHIATRGSFNSEQAIKAKQILLTKYDNKLPYLPTKYTFLFEIIYPENRIVCDYGGVEKLTLLGMIDPVTGNEVEYDTYKFLGDTRGANWDIVEKVEFKTFSGALPDLKESISDNEEGYVIRFKSGYRLKIKGDEYCRLHRLMTGTSSRDIIEHILLGKSIEELIKDVPDEHYDWVRKWETWTKQELHRYWVYSLKETARIIDMAGPNITQKEFADIVLKMPDNHLIFSTYHITKEHLLPKIAYKINKNAPFENPFKQTIDLTTNHD